MAVLQEAYDALVPGVYPFRELQALRSAIEGLSSSLEECEADVSDDEALAELRRNLYEVLYGE